MVRILHEIFLSARVVSKVVGGGWQEEGAELASQENYAISVCRYVEQHRQKRMNISDKRLIISCPMLLKCFFDQNVLALEPNWLNQKWKRRAWGVPSRAGGNQCASQCSLREGSPVQQEEQDTLQCCSAHSCTAYKEQVYAD